jgi:arylsulfatase A-like enzyme
MRPLAVLAFLTLTAPAQGRPPNIIHILADDVGYDDLSCFGARDIHTPNLDKLAARGVKLTSFYAPCSTCTPSRAAILTGCYAPRVGLPQVLFPTDRVGLSDEEVTIAQLLKGKGYATALIGKWHLGHLPRFLPPRHGFDLYLGTPYPNDHGPERLTQGPPETRKSRGFPPIPLLRGEKVVEQPAQLASLPERFAAEAVKFIADNKDRPFFLHYANIETHTPWLVARPFQYRSKAGVYGDAVQCLDWQVGRIVEAVEKNGLANDTLIVFSSDNGPLVHAYPELEGIYGHAAAVDLERRHLLKEGKYQSRWEGGTRVPFIACWPGKVPEGKTSDEVAAGFDLFTTFAAVARADLPKGRIIDGKDVSPLLFGRDGAKSPHEAFYYYQGYRLDAVRAGKWKLGLAGGKRGPNAPKAAELYDLTADVGEVKDVASSHPDVVKRLEELAEKMRDDLGDAAFDRPGKNRRPAGKEG